MDLPANRALAMHESLDYVLVEMRDTNSCIIVAEQLLVSCVDRYKAGNCQVLGTVKGSALEYQKFLSFLSHWCLLFWEST